MQSEIQPKCNRSAVLLCLSRRLQGKAGAFTGSAPFTLAQPPQCAVKAKNSSIKPTKKHTVPLQQVLPSVIYSLIWRNLVKLEFQNVLTFPKQ